MRKWFERQTRMGVVTLPVRHIREAGCQEDKCRATLEEETSTVICMLRTALSVGRQRKVKEEREWAVNQEN